MSISSFSLCSLYVLLCHSATILNSNFDIEVFLYKHSISVFHAIFYFFKISVQLVIFSVLLSTVAAYVCISSLLSDLTKIIFFDVRIILLIKYISLNPLICSCENYFVIFIFSCDKLYCCLLVSVITFMSFPV